MFLTFVALCVKWGMHTLCCFTVSNGMRQGSVLSPHLFTVYIDDLSRILTQSGTPRENLVSPFTEKVHFYLKQFILLYMQALDLIY